MPGFLDDLKKMTSDVVDTAAKAADELVEKGKIKATEMQLDGDLKKAYQELGAYAYDAYKSGTEDRAKMAQYFAKIADIEDQIKGAKLEEPTVKTTYTDAKASCPECGAGVEPGAMFCPRCGSKLPK